MALRDYRSPVVRSGLSSKINISLSAPGKYGRRPMRRTTPIPHPCSQNSQGSSPSGHLLTEKGRGLFLRIHVALRQWDEDFFFEPTRRRVCTTDAGLLKLRNIVSLVAGEGLEPPTPGL
jgi:hypothetical protein